jgi:DNA-directed RNA polymerase subunit K/omega
MRENLLSSLSEETNFEMKKPEPTPKVEKPNPEGLRRDLLAENYVQQCPNIYEAIIIMSQRARQIGQKQARVIERIMASKHQSDEDEDEEIAVRTFDEDDEDAPQLPKFEKPTVLAMNEMFRGDLKYKYQEE